MHPFAIGPGADQRSRLGFLLAIALLAMAAAAKPIVFDHLDPDCFWHLRVGEQLAREGVGPIIDHLSYGTVQTPWAPYSWLFELGLVRLWTVGGYRAVIAVQSLLQALFVCFLAAACQARLAPALTDIGPRGPGAAHPGALRAAVAALIGVLLAAPYLSLRPATLALVVLAACAWLIVRDRRGGERSRAVWCVAPLTALAVNIHLYALFVPLWAGALLLGAFWERRTGSDTAARVEADRRLERCGKFFLTVTLACLATPMLPGVIGTVVQYCFSDPMAGRRWDQMQTFFWTRTGQLAGLVIAACVMCVIVGRRRLRVGEILRLLLSIIVWLLFPRTAPMLALAAGSIVAAALPDLSDRVLGARVVRLAMCGVLFLGAWHIVRCFPARSQPLEAWLNRTGSATNAYPCEAANFVATHVQPRTARIINESNWGGYLEWRLGSRYQTLLDGRTQLFTPELWQATELATPEGRRDFLSEVQADAAVLPTHGSIFHATLLQLGWRVAYRDDHAEVLAPPPRRTRRTDGDWTTANLFFGDDD